MAKPIVPWIGGKRRLAGEILPLFNNHSCYVEPFVGAGALFFAKQPSESEVINDVHAELVTTYRCLKYHLEEVLRQFKWALSSREIFRWMKITEPETLTDVQRAARFIYLQKLAYGGRVDGQSFGTSTTGPPRLNILRLEEELSEAWLRLSHAHIEHLHWRDCVDRYDRPHTLTYCDPPYWETEGYGVEFGFEQYEALAEFALRAQGTVIISVNDHPEMRRVFDGLEMRSVAITYTVGGGDRQAARRELIMGNWKNGWPEPQRSQAELFERGPNEWLEG